MPGPADTYLAYGLPWANASNTPFRLYKHWVHEGGISTPLVVHWPKGIPKGRSGKLYHEAGHLMGLGDQYTTVSRNPYRTRPNAGHENDIMATLGGQAQQAAINEIVEDAGLDCPWWCCCDWLLVVSVVDIS